MYICVCVCACVYVYLCMLIDILTKSNHYLTI